MKRRILRYDLMKFGKYRYKTLDWVIRNDPSYIEWAIKTVKWVNFSDWTNNKIKKWRASRPKNSKNSYSYSNYYEPSYYDEYGWDMHECMDMGFPGF